LRRWLGSGRNRKYVSCPTLYGAEAQYESEQRQFRAGTSTVYLVLQRQTELITARTRELRAGADLGIAIADLDRATAGTIEAQNIKLQ